MDEPLSKDIKLDIIDKKILFELDKNCRIPASKIAKNLKISREIVKYRINSLIKKNIIDNFITIVDPSKLGYQLYKIHLQLSNLEEDRARFYDYLKNLGNVFWMGICDGSWDLILTVFARDSLHLYDLISGFLYEFRHLIVNKTIANFVHSYFYKKSFLTGELMKKIIIGDKVIYNKIDKLDKKILSELSNNARIPITELAKKLVCKPGTLRFRIKQLEDKGIILGYRLDLYLKKLNLSTYKAFIYYSYMDQKRKNALLEYVSRNPKLSYYLRVIAPWEGEIEFIVESHREFNEIINDLRRQFSDVIKGYDSVLINEEYWLPGFKA